MTIQNGYTQNPRETRNEKKKTVRTQRVSDYIVAKLHRSEISFLCAIIRGRAKFCNIEIEWISANSQKCVILNFHFSFFFISIRINILSYSLICFRDISPSFISILWVFGISRTLQYFGKMAFFNVIPHFSLGRISRALRFFEISTYVFIHDLYKKISRSKI